MRSRVEQSGLEHPGVVEMLSFLSAVNNLGQSSSIFGRAGISSYSRSLTSEELDNRES